MISIDYSITLGNIFEVLALAGTCLAFFYAMRSDIKVLRHDVRYLQDSFARLSSILTQVAVQDTRISMTEKAVDELRHGQGFITKING